MAETVHRAGRVRVLGGATLGLSLLGLAAFIEAAPRLAWNASASAPRGLYWIRPHEAAVSGDLVLVALPAAFRHFATERGYLADGVPLIKRVAATGGAEICGSNGTVTIDALTVPRLARDRAGRPMPRWNGCRILAAEEVFLLMADVPDSFDSRYFGPVEADRILGTLVPLCTE